MTPSPHPAGFNFCHNPPPRVGHIVSMSYIAVIYSDTLPDIVCCVHTHGRGELQDEHQKDE